MNWSLGIQQQIKDFAIDVSYVGSAAYHLLAQKNINPIPIGARFNKANEDPSQPGKPLADNYLRRYLGWRDINLRTNGYNSNYNSLQAQANAASPGACRSASRTPSPRRSAWRMATPPPSARTSRRGPATTARSAFDRPHVFVANFYYDLPKLGKMMGFKPAGWFLDNWKISGIWTVSSGSPFTPGLGWTTSTEVTGSTEGARVNIVGTCARPKDFYQWFNTGMVAPPVIGQWGNPNVTMANFGNAGVNVCRNPGMNNWDLSVGKRVPSVQGRPVHPVPDRDVQRLQPHPVLGTGHRDAVQPHHGSAEQPDLRTRHRRPRAQGDRALVAHRVLIVSLARAG